MPRIETINGLLQNILHGIGNTALLALRMIVPENGSRLLLKLESENTDPGSLPHTRAAVTPIERCEGA